MIRSSVADVFRFLSWLLFFATSRIKGHITMDPPPGVTPSKELIVDSKTEFTLTCNSDVPLDWAYSNYKWLDGEERYSVNEYKEHGQIVSTLTVRNAYYMDTGYFTCYPRGEDSMSLLAKSIYVYVRDPDNHLAISDFITSVTAHESETVNFPCRPTDPELEVVLMKDEEEMIPGLEYFGMTLNFDKHLGFNLKNVSYKNSGDYTCLTRYNGSEYEVGIFILGVLGNARSLRIPTVNYTRPAIEGQDVKFECKVEYDVRVKVYMEWSVPQHLTESGRLHKYEAYEEYVRSGKLKRKLGHHNIIVHNVSKKDEGDYTCLVIDSSGNKNQNSTHLNVIDQRYQL